MDAAEALVQQIHSLVAEQQKCAEQLEEVATKAEKRRKALNVSQVVGSVFSVLGASAVTAAGVVTGGTAVVPLLFAAKAGSVIGLGASVSAGVADCVESAKDVKDARKMSEQIVKHEQEIQRLLETLARDRGTADDCADESLEVYIWERILREMARQQGLVLGCKVRFLDLVFNFRTQLSLNLGAGLWKCPISCFKVFHLVLKILPETKGAGRTALKMMTSSAASKGAMKVATSTGAAASGRALKHVAGGALGLVVSVPELVYNCVQLNRCETDGSRSLRKTAEDLRTASETMRRELEQLCERLTDLAELKRLIENPDRSSEERDALMKCAMDHCEDDAVRLWLKEHAHSQVFFRLVDMFNFLKTKISEEEKKIVCKDNINITFVAHGSIGAPLIPASCLRPLPSIADVLLYSPWNCSIHADVAYGIATGRIKPEHRVFKHTKSPVPHPPPPPTDPPAHWNHMEKAAGQKIPTITVQTLGKLKDGAWDRFEILRGRHGEPGTDRVLIPFLLPGGSVTTVPFFVITLALALALMFSGYKATVHLAACLSTTPDSSLDEEELRRQYACTAAGTCMTTTHRMLSDPNDRLLQKLRGWFGL